MVSGRKIKDVQLSTGSVGNPVDNLLAFWRPAWHTVVGIIVGNLERLPIIRTYASAARGGFAPAERRRPLPQGWRHRAATKPVQLRPE